MINYRVDDLGEMMAQLRAGGVEIIQGPESHENGRFAWVMDPEGNKVELWEPMIGMKRTRAPEVLARAVQQRHAAELARWLGRYT